ncbi:hypothetical protein [Sporosarcina trichiuri]|uniref:hypothetical protein n=1 Tax=Sporosarcina trichiuri TaxID=3056445 RepID=UPI0025B4A8F7|nr:hypothetical protein [Sporosarcina sp. 0.2-SM1T-5]WJY27432.1 hypothetical protein QWT68_15545 [Sporosarcina sp. 0.2-SM1T-5]WJY27452.1 hypothetical protein QWT68_00065 [Sporosarcina sp. 0.2-SM1T-5]
MTTEQKTMMKDVYEQRKKRKALIASVEAAGLTKEKYENLKANKVTDGKIIEQFGLYATKLNNWKKAVGLLDGPSAAPAEEKKLPADNDLKDSLSRLKEKFDTPAPSPDVEEVPEIENPSLREKDVLTPVSEVTINYEKMCETKDKEIARLATLNESLNGKIARVNEKNAELAAENNKLYRTKPEAPDADLVADLRQRIASLEKELSDRNTDSEKADQAIVELTQELQAAHHRIEALKATEADYLQLEVDYRNQQTAYDRLLQRQNSLEETEQINHWLMKRCVAHVEQQSEVQ